MPSPPRLPVEWIDLDRLADADRNPRLHDVESVAASIRRFGYVEPGVLDLRTEKLVGGHGRAKALRWLRDRGELPRNWECDQPNVRVDGDGVWWVPTAVTTTRDADDAEALLIALNPDRPDRPGWERHGLAEMLDSIRASDGGLIGTGYDSDAVDKLLADVAQGSPELPSGDTEPALDPETSFRVAVECRDEQDQAQLVEELEGRGYTVHLQMS